MDRLDEKAIAAAEAEIARRALARFELAPETLVYDTTNFATFKPGEDVLGPPQVDGPELLRVPAKRFRALEGDPTTQVFRTSADVYGALARPGRLARPHLPPANRPSRRQRSSSGRGEPPG